MNDTPTVFAPDRSKIVESVLFLLEKARERRVPLDRPALLTILFLADAKHLSTYGRPIAYDNYAATPGGPVGIATSALLNDPASPWTQDLVPTRAADRDALSGSDETAMSVSLTLHRMAGRDGALGTAKMHPFYRDAWSKRDADASSVVMDWRRFPNLDAERLQEIVFYSRQGV